MQPGILDFLSIRIFVLKKLTYAYRQIQGRRHGGGGGAGGDRPPKGFKKGKLLKYEVFSCIKMSFSVIFNKEIHALRGLLLRF